VGVNGVTIAVINFPNRELGMLVAIESNREFLIRIPK